MGRHPGGGEAAHAALLARSDRMRRPLRPGGGPGAAGLDLDEDERGAVAGDDVELAVAGAGVAVDDLPAGGGKSLGDELLGEVAGPLT